MSSLSTKWLKESQNFGSPLVLNFGGQFMLAKPIEEFSNAEIEVFNVWKGGQALPVGNIRYFPEIRLPGMSSKVHLRSSWGISIETQVQESVDQLSDPLIFIDGDTEGNFQKLKARLCKNGEHVSELIEAFALNGVIYTLGPGRYKIALFLLWISGNSDAYSLDTNRMSLVYVYFGSNYCHSIATKSREGIPLDEKEQIIQALLDPNGYINLQKVKK